MKKLFLLVATVLIASVNSIQAFAGDPLKLYSALNPPKSLDDIATCPPGGAENRKNDPVPPKNIDCKILWNPSIYNSGRNHFIEKLRFYDFVIYDDSVEMKRGDRIIDLLKNAIIPVEDPDHPNSEFLKSIDNVTVREETRDVFNGKGEWQGVESKERIDGRFRNIWANESGYYYVEAFEGFCSEYNDGTLPEFAYARINIQNPYDDCLLIHGSLGDGMDSDYFSIKIPIIKKSKLSKLIQSAAPISPKVKPEGVLIKSPNTGFSSRSDDSMALIFGSFMFVAIIYKIRQFEKSGRL